ncbi:MAG: hypothetical protein RLZZ165_1809, partial [Bacteroidota bacterium]
GGEPDDDGEDFKPQDPSDIPFEILDTRGEEDHVASKAAKGKKKPPSEDRGGNQISLF